MGDSIPAALAGGDLFEYINFEQRCNIDARIANALRLTTEYLELLSDHQLPRNLVDAHVEWMRSKARFTKTDEAQYRKAKTSEQQRIAEDLQSLNTTAGVLWFTPKVTTLSRQRLPQPCTTFHVFMFSDLDRNGRTTPEMFERINLRLGESITARNELGVDKNENWRENATMLYGEIRPNGHSRFVDFGYPLPLVFSAEYKKLVDIGKAHIVQFPPLGMAIPKIIPTGIDICPWRREHTRWAHRICQNLNS